MYLTQALHRASQQSADRPALRYAGRTRTYRELVERVARLAGALHSLGMEQGQRVAMLGHNSDRYLEYQLAVPWAGGVQNPCNTRWSVLDIARTLEDSHTTILFVGDGFVELVDPILRNAPSVHSVIYAGEAEAPRGMHHYEALLAAEARLADQRRSGDDLLGLFYTRGSSGTPRGVMLSHTNVLSAALMLLGEGLAPRGGIHLHAAPMFEVANLGMSVAQLLSGNTHVVLPSLDAQSVLECIERQRITDVVLTAPLLQQLIDQPALARRDLTSLERVCCTASTPQTQLTARARVALPSVELCQIYGTTELSAVGALNLDRPDSQSEGPRKPGSVGRASLATELRVIDPAGYEVPRNQLGELVVRGPNVTLGYWNEPDETTEVLRGGWLHTGDGAYMDDVGFVYIVDRLRDMIVTRGQGVFPAEVERALAEHPAVSACAVIGIPEDNGGESVHALVVPVPGASISQASLIAHCKRRIASHKCPRSIELRDSLPLSSSGEILKALLREPYWRGHSRRVG